ncbi:hypothetical protein LINPERPRIM_LOCUS28272 [Linum perenne]
MHDGIQIQSAYSGTDQFLTTAMANRVFIKTRIPTRYIPGTAILLCYSPRPPPFFDSLTTWCCRRRPKTLKMAVMASSDSNKKRPTCPSCSKPLQVCLCAKLRHHGLFQNKVNVTILQHSLETKHPLNSARIAKIGLNNLHLHIVNDVQYDARFVIRIPGSGGASTCIITMKILKGGGIVDLNCELMSSFSNFDQILASPLVVKFALENGFTVQKLNRRNVSGSEQDYQEEFELNVPASSVLLYPSDESVSVDELRGMDFEVKNLIVLDGTWSKAKKMYKENPWLKLLPHLKLELGEPSLFSEVRRQPKAGCLSTIESIVHALKAAGEEPKERLDELLEVLGSMVADQRRYRDDRLSQISISSDASS